MTRKGDMRIGGLQKLSLIDYPGKLSCIVFTVGCNLRCPYCYNPDLVNGTCPIYPEETVFEFLENRRKLLDAVVITGGEPTLQPGLLGFSGRIKDMGLLVGLETNGTNPGVLQGLISKKLMDYVAMDIKAPLERYTEVTRAEVDTEKIRESIGVIMDSNVEYEFRTTCYPELEEKDFLQIFKLIEGAKKYALQQFSSEKTLADDVPEPYPTEFLSRVRDLGKDYFHEIELRK